MVAICGAEVRVLLVSYFCCKRLDDGLLVFVGDRLVMLIMATSLFCEDFS